ncbi:unnamed protein product [Paramecium sonneborni]|uniref:Uncharacterized protein n=1 Tax=Paramecium sonneborni TaxID=65129 RepID=A0A8S1RMR9_9CILI|nr:unnamed protein product [Paramecium sonneborni]
MVEETKTLIKQMNSEQQCKKIKENQRRMENFREKQFQVKELKMSINNTIEKVQINLEQKIALMEKEFEEQESKIQVSTFEEDVKILSKNYKGSFSFEVPKELDRCIDENTYINFIQEQFQQIFKCLQFDTIQETLMKIKVKQEHLEVKKHQLQTQKVKDQFLQNPMQQAWKRNYHAQFEFKRKKFSRLTCVECIQQNGPIKYTTLSDASLRWNKYRGQTDDKIQRFQNKKSQQYKNFSKALSVNNLIRRMKIVKQL